jgi:hypothetical protein
MARQTLSDLLRSYDVPPQLHDRLARVVYNLGGGRVPFVFTTAVLSALQTNAETAVLTTPPLNPGIDSAVVLLFGVYNIAPAGTGGTTVTTRLHRGTTIAGFQLVVNTLVDAVAGANVAPSIVTVDTPGAVAGLQYTLSGQMTVASANSNVLSGCLVALALG